MNYELRITNFKIKKDYLIFFIFLFLGILGLAKNTSAVALTATSCSSADVQAKITAAARGDTVIVPAGSCTWPSEILVTKSIKLQGAGIGSTVITSGLSCIDNSTCPFVVKYKPENPLADDSSNNGFEVTGFTFDGAYTSGIIKLENFNLTPVSNVKINNNKFLRSINKGTLVSPAEYQFMKVIIVYGTIYGVIYNNEFTGRPTFGFYGYPGNNGGHSSWTNLTFAPGTKYNMYVEDNTITDDADVMGNLISVGGWGGRYAFRYNDINFMTPGYSHAFFDMHGNQGSGYGTMGTEIYGNKLISVSSNYMPFNISGGQNIFMFNRFAVSAAGQSGRLNEQYSDSLVTDGTLCNSKGTEGLLYPTSYSCTLAGQPPHIWRSVFLNNRYGLAGTAGTLIGLYRLPFSGPELLVENEQYYNHQTSFNGTGVGCGSNLPSSCTKDKAFFWKTNQSCSTNTTGTYGKNPSTKIEGVLYRCSSPNIWEIYYIPYTYPHPLRGGTINTTPAAPTGVTIR